MRTSEMTKAQQELVADLEEPLRDMGCTIGNIPYDKLERAIAYAKAQGDDTVTVKIPSHSELSMSLAEAKLLLPVLRPSDSVYGSRW